MPAPPIATQPDIEMLLVPFASKHCIERGLKDIKVLDREIVDGYGFYTVQGTDEDAEPHATKVFPDGTVYCSCEGTRYNKLLEKKRLCSHLVATIADMAANGVDVSLTLKRLMFGSDVSG